MPKPPPDDSGYEVVEGPGYEVIDPPPAKPAPKSLPVARRLPDPAPAGGSRPKSRPGGPAGPTPKVAVLTDDDEPRPKRKRKKAGKETVSQDTNDAIMAWIGPAFLLAVGLVLTGLGSAGVARQQQVDQLPVVVGAMVGELVSIPLIIGVLVVVGSVFGIEYGSLGGAVLNLLGIGFFVGGAIWACEWGKVADFVYNPVLAIVTVGLFMTFFKLDMWETMVTVFCLNLLSFAVNFVLTLILFAAADKALRQQERDELDPPGKAGQVDRWDDDRPKAGRGKRPDPDDDE